MTVQVLKVLKELNLNPDALKLLITLSVEYSGQAKFIIPASVDKTDFNTLLELGLIKYDLGFYYVTDWKDWRKPSKKRSEDNGNVLRIVDVWNTYRLPWFAECPSSFNSKRHKDIKKLINDAGDIDTACEWLKNSLIYSKSDGFWKDKILDIENWLTNNKPYRLHCKQKIRNQNSAKAISQPETIPEPQKVEYDPQKWQSLKQTMRRVASA